MRGWGSARRAAGVVLALTLLVTWALAFARVEAAVDFSTRGYRVTDETDQSFVVSWTTDQPTTGAVIYGPTPGLGARAEDTRGPATSSTVHYVVVPGLRPNTTYYFAILTGIQLDNNGGQLYTARTGVPIAAITDPNSLTGVLVDATGSSVPPRDGLVYMRVVDGNGGETPGRSNWVARLPAPDGSFRVELTNRSEDLTRRFEFATFGDFVEVVADAGLGGTARRTLNTAVTDKGETPSAITLLLSLQATATPTPVTPTLTPVISPTAQPPTVTAVPAVPTPTSPPAATPVPMRTPAPVPPAQPTGYPAPSNPTPEPPDEEEAYPPPEEESEPTPMPPPKPAPPTNTPAPAKPGPPPTATPPPAKPGPPPPAVLPLTPTSPAKPGPPPPAVLPLTPTSPAKPGPPIVAQVSPTPRPPTQPTAYPAPPPAGALPTIAVPLPPTAIPAPPTTAPIVTPTSPPPVTAPATAPAPPIPPVVYAAIVGGILLMLAGVAVTVMGFLQARADRGY